MKINGIQIEIDFAFRKKEQSILKNRRLEIYLFFLRYECIV